MTPQERQLIAELFDRLASLEDKPRDYEAERAIAEEMRRAPHAMYALVQTVLVQDEALKQADARLRELEEGGGERGGSFLDNMRDALLGRRDEPPRAGSVPTVRPGGAWGDAYQGGGSGAPPGGAGWQPGYQQGYGQGGPPPGYQGGGSFLGTAAASAAGVIGGALLLNSFRGMFGGAHQGQSAFDPGGGSGQSPWTGTGSAADSDLARQAGLDDIGRSRMATDDSGSSRSLGAFDDQAAFDDAPDEGYDDSFDIGGDDTA